MASPQWWQREAACARLAAQSMCAHGSAQGPRSVQGAGMRPAAIVGLPPTRMGQSRDLAKGGARLVEHREVGNEGFEVGWPNAGRLRAEVHDRELTRLDEG